MPDRFLSDGDLDRLRDAAQAVRGMRLEVHGDTGQLCDGNRPIAHGVDRHDPQAQWLVAVRPDLVSALVDEVHALRAGR